MLSADDDPYLDAGVRGHIVRLAHQHVHRLRGWDKEDLIQEGYLCYSVVKNRYVGKRPKRKPDGTYRRELPLCRPDQTARKHFMRLLQRTITNRISSLTRKQSKATELLLNDLVDRMAGHFPTEVSAMENFMPPEEEQATTLCLLRSAPTEILQLFALMVDDVITRPMRRFGKRRRETTNAYYCRLLKLPRGYDLTGLVQKHFLG